jgi:hypothetical protein
MHQQQSSTARRAATTCNSDATRLTPSKRGLLQHRQRRCKTTTLPAVQALQQRQTSFLRPATHRLCVGYGSSTAAAAAAFVLQLDCCSKNTTHSNHVPHNSLLLHIAGLRRLCGSVLLALQQQQHQLKASCYFTHAALRAICRNCLRRCCCC